MKIPSLAFLLTIASFATAEDKEAQSRTLRILPLGDNPPFRQEVREGARYEIAPEAGTIPPPTVLLPTSGEEAPGRVSLRLGSPTLLIKLPAGEEPGKLALRDAEGKAWTEIPYTEKPSTLTLIWRGSKTWGDVGSLALIDGKDAFDKNSCRFVNLTNAPLGVSWGSLQKGLSPGEVAILPFQEGARQTPLLISYATKDGDLRPCLQTIVERSALLSQQFFIYRADGEDVRMPVKVLHFRENR